MAAETEEQESSPEAQKSKEFEISGVKAAEVGNIAEAIQLFTKAIEICPERASGYNNRAQVRYLKIKEDEKGSNFCVKFPKNCAEQRFYVLAPPHLVYNMA